MIDLYFSRVINRKILTNLYFINIGYFYNFFRKDKLLSIDLRSSIPPLEERTKVNLALEVVCWVVINLWLYVGDFCRLLISIDLLLILAKDNDICT